MTFSQFLSILRARWWAALLVFLLVLGTTLGVSLVLPKKYSGTASVVIDVKPDPVSAMAFPGMAMPSFMATQVDILGSERVAMRVIRDLKLLDNPNIRQQWLEDTEGNGSVEQWLVQLLLKQLDVRPSRESNVITVQYSAPDPRFAAAMANAFAQAYIATTLELKVDPAKQFTTFFNTQTKEARESLEKAQTRLSAYQREKGIIATDERLDIETSRLNELSSQLVMMQAVASESSSRQAAAQGKQGDRIQEVLNNPLVAGLKSDLARNEARLQELSAKFGDSHPQVIEAQANIGTLRNRLEQETSKVTGGVTINNTINREREAQVRKQLDAQRAKVLQMKSLRDEGQVLIRDVENAQRTFDSLMARFNQTALESQTTQSYANMLTMAQPASEPSSPRVVLNMFVAVFVGTLLALGVALVLELLDRRVRNPEDAVLALGLPVLGVMPKPKAKRYVSGRRSLVLQRPAHSMGLPAPQTDSRGM